MIYFYAIYLIANICNGVTAFIAADYEIAQHNEILGLLILILITLEAKENE